MQTKGSLLPAMKPLSALSSLFYLLMFQVKSGKVVVSGPKAIMSSCLMVACSAFKCWKLYQTSSANYEQFLVCLDGYLLVGCCAASHLNVQFHSQSLTKIWNEILPLAELITEKSFYKKTFLFSCAQVGLPHLVFLTYLALYYHFYSEDFAEPLFLLEFVVDYFMSLHLYGVTVFFSSGLLLGSKVISLANAELEKLREVEHCRERLLVKVAKMKELSSQMKMIKQEKLSPLVEVYEKVCTCSEQLNGLFGVSLTTTSLRNLMEMVLSCYFMIKHGLVAVKLMSTLFFHCFLTELIIIYSCEKFMKEAKRTGNILDLVVTESSSQVLKDAVSLNPLGARQLVLESDLESVRLQVQRFSQHLLHHQLRFTACGLFDFNYKFLFSVFSNVITYLTIVVQFDKSP